MTEQITLQKALFTIKKLKHLLQEQKNKSEPIAIIGMSCRFPQTIGKDAYWEMLTSGKNIISKIPNARWELLNNTHEIALKDPNHPYWGGYLDNISLFDAYFFGISPREAIRIDPQHRFLLEVAYEALEDAGLPVESLAGSKTGVFSSLYVSQLAHMQKMDTEMDALFLPTGNAISIAANRISYLFDLRGPSIIIDSACSSSMAALHLACLNLQNNTCEMALVCGAKMNLLPYVNFVLTNAKMLSTDGQCKTFDANANGYVQGEGVGVIVLKPLSQALKDHDRIYSVIMGSALNQDGRTNGLTAPNGLQQEDLLKTAYKNSNINPLDISYVECHGTGTFLGDPIEIEALGEIIGKNRQKTHPCWIGSVKTNIGHLEPAAGIASIIKVALALQHAKIPPHLNYATPNPHIAFDKYQLKIPLKIEEWPQYGEYRIAAMSGFGFGGTNAHVVMRELSLAEKQSPTTGTPSDSELFVVSAKDPEALKLYIKKWCDFLEKTPNINLSQLCYNTHVRKSHYVYRLAVIANSIEELHHTLNLIHQNPSATSSKHFINFEKNKSIRSSAVEDFSGMDLKTIAERYVNYTQIDWKKFEAHRQYLHTDMPIYPWQHKQYWPPLGNMDQSHDVSQPNPYPLRGQFIPSPLHNLQFEFLIDNQHIPDLKDTYNILHAGYYLEIIAFAVKELTQQATFTIEDHAFLSPLIVPNNTTIRVQLVLEKTNSEKFNFSFYSNTYGQKNWVEHAKGKLLLSATQDRTIDSIPDIQKRCNTQEPAEKLYEKIIAMGMPAGESIRWTQQYWKNNKEILCEFNQPTDEAKNSSFILNIHPGIFDASIQPVFKLLPDEFMNPYIASSAAQLKFHGIKSGPYYLLGTLKHIDSHAGKITADCILLNKNSDIIAEFNDICLTQLDNKIEIEKIMAAKEKHGKIDFTTMPQEQQKSFITEFLVEQIAIIFSIPKEDIEINRSLRDMGIDSLMALVLMRTLELGLGVTYAMQDLLEGPSITELADYVLQHQTSSSQHVVHDAAPDNPNPWIAYRKHSTRAQCRIFCFPYGGGGASMYHDWQDALPDTIEVCPIQLPGRENRMNETSVSDMKLLIAALIEHLKPEFNLPFAFFGHSIGSLISFELTRSLRRQNLPLPFHLFISAFPDPRTPAHSLNKLLDQLKSIQIDLFDFTQPDFVNQLSDHTLKQLSDIFSERGIADYGDHLMNKDVVKMLLPIFSGDMNIAKNYNFYGEAPLNIPFTVFAGQRDAWVAYDDHLSWKHHTQKSCDIITFDSGHLFIKDRAIRKQILETIVKKVENLMAIPV